MKHLRIGVLGSGGREAALVWKLRQGGGGERVHTLAAPTSDSFETFGRLLQEKKLHMLVVGPEAPLVEGLVDYIEKIPSLARLRVVGPRQRAARLEGSKVFSKQFMQRHRIPTAPFAAFTKRSLSEALHYLRKSAAPYVLKASGLAQGKGVVITHELKEAENTVRSILCEDKFGSAGKEVVLESYLEGRELSCFLLAHGTRYVLLPMAKDYKRVYDQDKGPNTGGMGAVSPVPWVSQVLVDRIKRDIVEPTLQGMLKEDSSYTGFLFVGLMVVGDKPYVLEYNVRLGDPETQAILPRIQGDFAELLWHACEGKLPQKLDLLPHSSASLALTAKGYPNAYPKGQRIEGLDQLPDDVHVFLAGTKKEGEDYLTDGGRVLHLVGVSPTLSEARDRVYRAAEKIRWRDVHYRKDIGQDLLV